MQRAALVLAVALGTLCVLPALAGADDTVVRGSVQDPRGDAYVSPFALNGEGADVKQIKVTYDRAAGIFRIEAKVWSGPVPAGTLVKQFNAFRDCSPSSPQVLYQDAAAWFNLLVSGAGWPQPTPVHEREIRGNHVMETWSGPTLKQLDIGCVRDGRVTIGIINVGSADEFDTVELR